MFELMPTLDLVHDTSRVPPSSGAPEVAAPGTGVDDEVHRGEQNSDDAAKKDGFGSEEKREIGRMKTNMTPGPTVSESSL
jgi:hypothetical protein